MVRKASFWSAFEELAGNCCIELDAKLKTRGRECDEFPPPLFMGGVKTLTDSREEDDQDMYFSDISVFRQSNAVSVIALVGEKTKSREQRDSNEYYWPSGICGINSESYTQST